MSTLFTAWILISGVAWSSGYYTDPHCRDNTRAIAYLFEWTWLEISRECPLLAEIGYCGVQVPIPTEHYVEMGAWWERNNPVSYKIESMSGTETQFIDMVEECNRHGVNVYVGLQLNHMSLGEGFGYNGTFYNSTVLVYDGERFTEEHFHDESDCPGGQLHRESPARDLQGCLVHGPDLKQSDPYVQQAMAGLINKLLGVGVTGFFLKDAYHISPDDIISLLEMVDNDKSGNRPFFTHNVFTTTYDSDDLSPDMFYDIGRVTDFKMSEILGDSLITEKDLSNLCASLNSPPLVPAEGAVVFVDEPTYQRGFHPSGGATVTFKTPELYTIAQSFVLASDFGIPRVMSSFDFSEDGDGRPDYEPCGDRWICEHSWPEISAMVQFSNDLRGLAIRQCVSTKNSVRFSRGRNGHFWAGLVGADKTMITKGLKPGHYLDLVSQQNEQVLNDQTGLSTFNFTGQNVAALVYTGPLEDPTTEVTLTETQIQVTTSDLLMTILTTQTPTVAHTPEPDALTTSAQPDETTPTTTSDVLINSVTTSATVQLQDTSTTFEPTSTGNPQQLTTELFTTTPSFTTIPENANIDDGKTTVVQRTTAGNDITTQPPVATGEMSSTPPTSKARLAVVNTTRTPVPEKTDPYTTKSPDAWRRTVIFIERETDGGQYTFLRGGNPAAVRDFDKEFTRSGIPIRHRELDIKGDVNKRNVWTKGDNYLDWGENESTQTDRFDGFLAQGSPMQWTAHNDDDHHYHPLNNHGKQHMWMVDIDMDCSKTWNGTGFFQVKGVDLKGNYEPNLELQGSSGVCNGVKSVPWESINHWAMCGRISVFEWGKAACEIYDFDQ